MSDDKIAGSIGNGGAEMPQDDGVGEGFPAGMIMQQGNAQEAVEEDNTVYRTTTIKLPRQSGEVTTIKVKSKMDPFSGDTETECAVLAQEGDPLDLSSDELDRIARLIGSIFSS